jgi:hypothetical protein
MPRWGNTDGPAVAPRAEQRLARWLAPDGPIERTTTSLCLWPWVMLAVREGLSVASFCELAGITEGELRDPAMRFSQPVTDRVAQLAYARFGPGAAMQAAQLIESGHFHLLELIARSVPTVHDGLAHGCRFFGLLHSGGHVAYEPHASGGGTLRWDPPHSYTVHHGYVELMFAVAMVGIRRETARPDAAPDEVWFRHRAPDDCALHARVLGVQPRFEMPEDHVVFGTELVALHLTRENAAVHRAAAEAGALLLDE